MKDVIKTTQRPDEIKTINGRRVRVNRRERRNNNLKSYYAIAVVFAAFIVMFLCLTVFFRISNVDIKGVTYYRPEQIMAAGGIEKGANLVRTDTGYIEERLKKALVYVDDVKVKKDYPSGIVVECTQAVKAADIKVGKSYTVVSSSGRILETNNAKRNPSIPLVEGFELKNDIAGSALESRDKGKDTMLVKLLNAINKAGIQGITRINIKSKGNIILTYKERIQIKLGGVSDVDYKLSYFKEVIKRLTDDYEGTLIYNGTEGGISAIPKEDETSSSQKDSSSQNDSSENSSETDSSSGSGLSDSSQYADDTSSSADSSQAAVTQWSHMEDTTPEPSQQTTQPENQTYTNGYQADNGNTWQTTAPTQEENYSWNDGTNDYTGNYNNGQDYYGN